MDHGILHHRILAALYTNTEEDIELMNARMKKAAGGAFPYAVREMMKDHAWSVIHGVGDEQTKETARLLICYSWWARALEGGIPKKFFEEFMLDHLEYLDRPDAKGSGDKLFLDKWKKYG